MLGSRAAIIFIVVLFSLPVVASEPAPETGPIGVALEGSVLNQRGEPLVGAVVSVFGKNLAKGALIAVTDDTGQFQLDGVPPGIYRLRAYLSGFLPSAYAKVIVDEGVERVGAVLMSLAQIDASGQPDEDAERQRTASELRWLLAHAERNALKDKEWSLPKVASIEAFDDNARSPFASAFAFGGEFGVHMAAYDQVLDEFPGSGAGLDGRLAFARLFIPTDEQGQWLVSAQLLESALSSWAGRAEFSQAMRSGHQLTAGVTYGNYLYGDLEDFRPPEAALSYRETGQRSTEWFGSVYASDTFQLGRANVHGGVQYDYFSYLQKSGYASPRMEVAFPVGDNDKTFLKGAVDYRVLAPGGEDIGLLSRVAYSDVYGPTPATRSGLRAERTARFQLGLERQVSDHTRIGVRMFQENADDQLVKAYTQDAAAESRGGYFRVGNHGDFQTRGLGLSVSQSYGAVEGSVGYTFGMGRALAPRLIGAPSPSDEEIHDVTTAVATSIDRTRTRLQAAYRFVSHPTFAPGQGFTQDTTTDSRFSIQVYQVLPFVGWNGTSWELMVAVRNLFYEDLENASILDEIAVIDAPRRVLGGVTVRF